MKLPDSFRLILTGRIIDVLVRSNITPGALGRLLEHLLTGGKLDDTGVRGWGLTVEVDQPPRIDEGPDGRREVA